MRGTGPEVTSLLPCTVRVKSNYGNFHNFNKAPEHNDLEAQNFVTSLKWKLLTFIAGTTISKDSSPAARTAGPSISTFDSISRIF